MAKSNVKELRYALTKKEIEQLPPIKISFKQRIKWWFEDHEPVFIIGFGSIGILTSAMLLIAMLLR